jgi:predicted RNase H-like HicB family nuclease
MNMHTYPIVIETAGANFSAYSPDLPGCVATGATREETAKHMDEAIQMHIEGLRHDGLVAPVSAPR